MAPGATAAGNSTERWGAGIDNIPGLATLEAGALVCGNSPPRCEGPFAGPGACPIAADACPPA